MASTHRNYTPKVFDEPETRGISLDNPAVSLSSAFDLVFGGKSSFSGETVNETTAYGVPAIQAAINVISGTIAALPIHLYRDDGDTRVKADSDPLYRVIHDVVNSDFETSYSWRKKMMMRLLLGGRAYSFIERNKAGRVTGLWYLDPSRVTVVIRDGRKSYLYRRADGVEFIYQPGEIIDFVREPAPDGLSHINPIENNRNAIGLMIAATRYASIMFENGGVPPLSLTGPAMSPQAATRASADIQEALRRARDEKRNVLVTPPGYELKAIGIDTAKLQMLELQRFLICDVARIWNVPPSFLHDLTSGTFNNVEQQDLAFAKHTLTPLLELIESEMNAKLFSDRNRANCVEFDLEGLKRGDFTSQTNGFRTLINTGVMTVNEARAKLNLPPVDGGDRALVQGAMIALDDVGKVPPTAPATPDPEDPTNTSLTDNPPQDAAQGT